jgi:hypothetical protein
MVITDRYALDDMGNFAVDTGTRLEGTADGGLALRCANGHLNRVKRVSGDGEAPRYRML